MWFTDKLVRSGLAAALFLSCGVFTFAATPAQMLNLPAEAVVTGDDDEDASEVRARVARISFIHGEAQVRRAGAEEWEKATLNLPLVEGDEIVTDNDSRIEIQFDTTKHLRLNENAYLRIVTLKDEGIAVSVSLGTASLRLTKFDNERSYFEIDAPKTTIAVQREGTYRIDAGHEGMSEIRVTATDGGEARVYADNMGFKLKNNRSALVFIDGDRLGEWESAEASRFTDWFDEWADDRDKVIAKRLRDAHYDEYYDRDIYGADDLDEYGEWVHTRDYGYVWRPYRRVTSYYADWSPYRYGHWRWISPFGWTWVNDEPWGWATYHHGRWVYYGGYWNWSPYGYYRYSRSWWRPALVVINIFNNNVCWYPLPYHYGYYNYNGYYGGYYGGGHHNNVTPTIGPHGGVKPIPPRIKVRENMLAADVVPASGVVTTPVASFSTSIKSIRKAPASVANAVLAVKPADINPTALEPVAIKTAKVPPREIKADPPPVKPAPTRVGAAIRKNDAPLDSELRTTRVFGGRSPVKPADSQPTTTGGSPPPRNTGAVTRSPVRQSDPPEPVRQPPVRNDPPVRQPPPRNDSEPVRQPPPRNDPPPVRQQPPPRSDPPPVRQPPRNDPPPVKQSPPKSDPPPTKSEPKAPRKSDAAG